METAVVVVPTEVSKYLIQSEILTLQCVTRRFLRAFTRLNLKLDLGSSSDLLPLENLIGRGWNVTSIKINTLQQLRHLLLLKHLVVSTL